MTTQKELREPKEFLSKNSKKFEESTKAVEQSMKIIESNCQ